MHEVKYGQTTVKELLQLWFDRKVNAEPHLKRASAKKVEMSPIYAAYEWRMSHVRG